MNKKVLIAYFSRAGNNYVGGAIVNLTVGNTEVAMNTVEKLTGGEMFRIDPVNKYAADYTECARRRSGSFALTPAPSWWDTWILLTTLTRLFWVIQISGAQCRCRFSPSSNDMTSPEN